MSDIALSLGPVEFRGFEVPSGIHFGGRQLLAVHQLAGGQRIVDCLGPADTEISFNGVFSGPAATRRARLLDELRSQGRELRLTWDVFSYTVVLSRFDAEYRNPNWIPYRSVCSVVRDEALAVATLSASLRDPPLTDLQAAIAIYVDTDIIAPSIQSLATMPQVNEIGSTANKAAIAAIADARSGIRRQLVSAESLLAGVISKDATPWVYSASNLKTAIDAAAGIVNALYADGYLGRAAHTLANTDD